MSPVPFQSRLDQLCCQLCGLGVIRSRPLGKPQFCADAKPQKFCARHAGNRDAGIFAFGYVCLGFTNRGFHSVRYGHCQSPLRVRPYQRPLAAAVSEFYRCRLCEDKRKIMPQGAASIARVTEPGEGWQAYFNWVPNSRPPRVAIRNDVPQKRAPTLQAGLREFRSGVSCQEAGFCSVCSARFCLISFTLSSRSSACFVSASRSAVDSTISALRR